MLTESVTSELVCSKCGTVGFVAHTEICTKRGLRYVASFRCEACGMATEADDVVTPEPVRALFIAHHGYWRLVIVAPGRDRGAVVRRISERLSIGLPEALRLVKAQPAEVGRGTRVEMECMGEELHFLGASVELRREETSG